MTHAVEMPNVQKVAGSTYYALRMPHGSETQEFLVIDRETRRDRLVTRKRRKGLVERERAECALIDEQLGELVR